MAKPLGASPSFLVVLCITVLWPTLHTGEYCQKPEGKTALFIFGDSLFDVGNNNYINTTTLDQANFWPYGETYFKSPTGRFSDGRLITDFIGTVSRGGARVLVMNFTI